MLKAKILGTFLLLLCFGLLASSVSAVEIPVEVERIKDVCYVRVRGAHQPPPDVGETKPGYGFLLLSYKNLMTGTLKGQYVEVEWTHDGFGHSFSFMAFPKGVGGVLDGEDLYCLDPGLIGTIFDFEINVSFGSVPQATITGSVVIPPA